MSTVALEDVLGKIAELSGLPQPLTITADTPLASLFADSFALVEMAIALQEDFDAVFTQDDLRDVTTVGQIFELLRSTVRRSDDE